MGAVTVELRDASGHLVTTNRSVVTLSLASGPGTGMIVARARLVNGVARFSNISETKASFYSFEADEGGLSPALSNVFNVSPGAPTRLHVVDLAASNGGYYQGDVEVLDRYGNRVAENGTTLSFMPDSASKRLGIGLSGSGMGNLTPVFDEGVTPVFLFANKTGTGSGLFVSSERGVRPARSGRLVIS
jgi:hypothetical protein